MGASRALSGLTLLAVGYAQLNRDMESMIRAGEDMVQSALLFDEGWTADRYAVAAEGLKTNEMAANGVQDELHGVYGEFPLRAMAELLAHPAVGPCWTCVDLGSGAGRLLFGLSGMLGQEANVHGIEASPALHMIAEKAVASLVSQGKLRAGAISSILGDVTE